MIIKSKIASICAALRHSALLYVNLRYLVGVIGRAKRLCFASSVRPIPQTDSDSDADADSQILPIPSPIPIPIPKYTIFLCSTFIP